MEEIVYESPDVGTGDFNNDQKNPSGDIMFSSRFAHHQNGSIDYDEQIRPQEAFEAFAGKTYTTLKDDFPQDTFEYNNETLLQKYTRLKLELNQLENDLTSLAEEEGKNQKTKLIVDVSTHVEYEQMSQGISRLNLQLNEIGTKDSFQPFLNPQSQVDESIQLQHQLSAQLLKDVESLKKQKKTSSDSSAADTPSLTYELYYDRANTTGGKNPALNKDQYRLAVLEDRIFQLEKLITGSEDTSAIAEQSKSTILSSMNELEDRIDLLNEKKLDAIASRVTALLHEFTMLNRQREQTNVKLNSEEIKEREKINALYEQIENFDQISAALPAIVARMKSLQHLHKQSETFNDRLNTVEQSNDQISRLLETDAALLKNVEKNLQENVEIFQSNIAKLDQRMEDLLKKIT